MRDSVKIEGRILYLTKDPELLRRQLDGEEIAWDPSIELIDNISTDELTPGWVCYYYDETLAEYCLVGLRGGVVKKDDIKKGGFGVIVSGLSKGCGSSRETAPFSGDWPRRRPARRSPRSIEKIYGQNCQNIGLLTTTDFGTPRARSRRGEEIPIDGVHEGLDPIADRHRASTAVSSSLQQGAARGRRPRRPRSTRRQRPMTLVREDHRASTRSPTPRPAPARNPRRQAGRRTLRP
jgi:hypothetical protein